MLVQTEMRDGYHYETLADKRTFDYASSHLDEWINALPTPCIIDEAQRISDLPLAIKNVVDGKEGSNPLFVLTGSAAITRNGLDGQDPLTRRSIRYSLYPLTRRELNKNTSISAVDLLWNGIPNTDYHSETDRNALSRYMAIGGFPSYILSSVPITDNDLRLAVRTDIDNVLGDTILPGERLDRTIANAVLTELLAVPGSILNVKKKSDTISSNPATIERYISIFLRRFLISALPNLRSAPGKQIFTRAKIHPIGTSFSAEILRQSGRDFREDRVLFGELFESFAVNQIVPEIQWSSIHPDAFYWREPGSKPKEVDLVLLHDDQLIALEMKSNNTVNRQDFAGIAALADKDKRFHRGYVFYTGDKVQQFNEHMWALPISALWDSDGFLREETAPLAVTRSLLTSPATQPETITSDSLGEGPIDANLFLSYSHDDNVHLDGAVIRLIEDIIKEYKYEYGSGLGLFIDKDSINWGENWRDALDRGIDTANVILPIISPNYIRSASCRKELLDFDARVTENGTNRILPLMLRNIDGMTGINKQDPVWSIAHNRQWIQVGELRLMSGKEYQRKVLDIVARLRTVIEDIANKSRNDNPTQEESHIQDGDKGPALLSLWSELEHLTPQINVAANEFTESFQGIMTIVNNQPSPVNGDAAAYSAWAEHLSNDLNPALKRLNNSTDNLSNLWHHAYSIMNQTVGFIQDLPQGSLRNSQIDNIGATFDNMHTSFAIQPEATQAMPTVRLIGNLFRPLQPFADGIEQSFNLITNMGTMIAALQNRLNRIPR